MSIEVPILEDKVACIDERTAVLLDRYRVALNHVVIDAETVPECEINYLALLALEALKIVKRVRGRPDTYRFNPKAKLGSGVFRNLCVLLEGRVRAIQEDNGFFLSMPLPVWDRLTRRLFPNAMLE